MPPLRCHCGTINIDYNVPPPHQVYLCHCDSCRHFTGALGLPCIVPPDPSPGFSWRPDPADLERMTAYVFGPLLTWYSCPKCSARVIVRMLYEGKLSWGIATGLIEDPSGFQITDHIFVSDTKDGGVAVWLKDYAGRRAKCWIGHSWGGTEMEYPAFPPKPQARLEREWVDGYCMCRSVKFQVQGRQGKPVHADLSDDCRRATGLEMVEWVSVARSDIKPQDSPLESWSSLQSYASDKDTVRFNCKTCGAAVFTVSQTNPDQVRVALGVLAADEGSRAERWLEWPKDPLYGVHQAVQRHPAFVKALQQAMSV